MKKLLAILLAWILILPGLAKADGSALPPVPASGNVTLPLDEYNHLLELASKPVRKTDTPPVPYSMKRADLKFRVTDESVQGTVQLQGEILHKGATKVPLTTGMAILDARQEGKSLPLALENGTHTAVLNGPSEFSVSLDAGLPLNIEAGRASFSLPAPSAGSVRFALVVPGDHTNVRVSPGLITARSSANGQTSIEATLVPGVQANIWWTTREAAAPVVPKEVRFLSDVKTLVSVSEAEIRIAALADISVVQGEPAQFEIEIPAGYEVTGTTGASIESSEVESGVLVLKVGAPAQRSHQFLISMEKSITATNVDAPFLSFKNAQRETGEVLVDGAGTIELTAKEAGGLKRMDFKETNPYLRSLSRFPMQAAFRYHKQPSEKPSLALEWTRFPDSSVLSAVVERAVVTTLVTTEGRSLTEIKLLVNNQAQPFLKIALPAGASILTAEVAGEKVKPVEGPDGNRVPLLRPGFRPTDSYSVSFVFIHSGAPFAKKGGSDISLPRMDIPIDLLQWEVFLPERYKVKDFGGDAIAANLLPPAPQDVSGAEEFQSLELFGRVSSASLGAATQTVTVEASNGPYNARDSERLERNARKIAAQQQMAASANVTNLQQRVSGVLPVRIDVPRAGNSYHFVRPLVLDEETKVSFTYKSK
ncbi:MAG: hypothetical protein DMG44_08710 [Acidobacteria bacterium]|nr:MAG: hypothetical protein DMG44_08710 [Acidobacteriota bacterium]